MNQKILLLFSVALAPASSWAFDLHGLDATAKGLTIIKEADQRDQGWQDMTSSSEMILRNRQGKESRRHTHSKALEVTGDGDKTLIVFDQPRDVKGTAFLSYSHALKADEQWIFLPALKRIKRISSRNKSGPFMGSEFAYEDISSQEVKKYSYRYIKDAVLDGHKSWVVEQIPAYKNSGYTRLQVWMDQQDFYPLKVVFYDRRNAQLKTLTYHGYHQYAGHYWRPDRMEMVNQQTGKSTTLLWKDYHFGNGFSVRDFDKNSLKRAH